MSPTTDQAETEVGGALDRLAASAATESNCLFQLALMMARIAVEPCADSYKEEAAQALMGLIRAKPKSNVVRLLGAPRAPGAPTALQVAARRREPALELRDPLIYSLHVASANMAINGIRNKPYGPRGGTGRVHPSLRQMRGFRWARNRIDVGVKGSLLLGIVPPLSG